MPEMMELKRNEMSCDIYDWNTILEIPGEQEEEYTHMLRQYGSVTMEQVKNHARTYVNVQCRAAQDSQQLADCILNSLIVEARNTITLYDNGYVISGKVSGFCLLNLCNS